MAADKPSRNRGAYLAALLASVLVPPDGVVAQAVEGVLLERGNDRPVALALVALLTIEGDSVAAVISDDQGRFRVESPEPGEFLLSASALGYRPTIASSIFDLTEDGSVSLEFRIETLPIELGGLEIEASSSMLRQPRLVRNGFVERVHRGMGRFITPVDIEKSTAFTTTEMLSRTGRVTTRFQLGGDRILMRGSFGLCTPTIYIDGARADAEFPLDVIAPKVVVAGVEIYRSAAEAPPQYAVGVSRCGVIVLWTKGW